MSENSEIKVKDFVKVKDGILVKKPGKPSSAKSRNSGKTTGRQLRVAGGERKTYTDHQKMEAVCAFAVCGNSRRVAEITGISEATIRSWKQTEWWYEAQERVVQEENEELDTKLTALINKAVTGVNDRLDNGDYLYDAKKSKLVRKPMSGKDIAIVTAISLDKRQLLRGQPTSRIEKVSQDERLLKLAEQFKHFTNAKEVLQVKDVEDPNLIVAE